MVTGIPTFARLLRWESDSGCTESFWWLTRQTYVLNAVFGPCPTDRLSQGRERRGSARPAEAFIGLQYLGGDLTNYLYLHSKAVWRNGSASDYESGGCSFEYYLGHIFSPSPIVS